jgi:lysozyme family protein
MADFEISHKKTSMNEGGWANNLADKGGETFRGISRKFWPKWAGWTIIDAEKKKLVAPPPFGTREFRNWVAELDKRLATNTQLSAYVDEFYKVNFWDAFRCGEIHSQSVADWLYDHTVNAGARGAKWIQEAVGAEIDGDIGPKSIEIINASIPEVVLSNAKKIAGDYRMKKIAADPTQRQFAKSWLSRDGFTAEEIKEMLA